MAVEAVVHRATRQARRAGNSDWVERAARLGFAARGLLYLTVAFLAASIAAGRGGQTADKQGAVRALADTPIGTLDFDPQEAKGVEGTLRTIAEQPYGKALLLLAAAGLAAFGLFSLVEARYRRL